MTRPLIPLRTLPGFGTTRETISGACILMALLCFAACSADRRPDPLVVVRDSAGVRVIETRLPHPTERIEDNRIVVDTIPRLQIGSADGGEDHELHQVSDALVLTDGSILIANSGSQGLRLYSSAGEFVRSFGRRGEGPGEFSPQAAPHLFLKRGRLIATDATFRVHVYDASLLEYETTTRLEYADSFPRPSLHGVFADGSWLVAAIRGGGTLAGSPGALITGEIVLFRHDGDGKRISQLTSIRDVPRIVHHSGGITSYPVQPFAAQDLAAVDDTLLVEQPTESSSLRYRDLSGRLVRVVRWSRVPVRSSELWQSYSDDYTRRVASAPGPVRQHLESFVANRPPIPEHAALYRDMKVDDRGVVWLERADLPPDGHRVWDTIGRDGTWHGSIVLPRAFQMLHPTEKFLIGRIRDSLGVERVALLEVHRNRVP